MVSEATKQLEYADSEVDKVTSSTSKLKEDVLMQDAQPKLTTGGNADLVHEGSPVGAEQARPRSGGLEEEGPLYRGLSTRDNANNGPETLASYDVSHFVQRQFPETRTTIYFTKTTQAESPSSLLFDFDLTKVFGAGDIAKPSKAPSIRKSHSVYTENTSI